MTRRSKGRFDTGLIVVFLLLMPSPGQTAGPRINSITPANGKIQIRWEGGSPPYQMELRTNLDSSWVEGPVFATNSSFTQLNVEPSTYYRVKAGFRSASDNTPPTVPLGLRSSADFRGRIHLFWNASIDAESGVKGYLIYRDGVYLRTVLAPSTSILDSSVQVGMNHSYTIQAYDFADNVSPIGAQSAMFSDFVAPSIPSGLTASAVGCSRINLRWNPSADAGGIGLEGYLVYRNNVFIAEVLAPSTTYSDTGLASSTSYTYAVSARDEAHNASARSPSVSATTPGCADTSTPSVPAGLTARAEGCYQINLAWSASTDTGSGLKGYNVYRGGIFLVQVLAPTTSFNDLGLLPATTYAYTVSAVDNANNSSAQSSSAIATTPACGACSYGLSSPGASIGNASASGSFSISTSVGCAWTATPNVSWIQIAGNNNGVGNGTVSWFAAANVSVSPRSGVIVVNGQPFTIDQAGASCSYSLTGSSASFPWSGGGGSVGVTTSSGCGWLATPSTGWISITSGSAGAGNGTVGYSVSLNPSSSPRSGTIFIGSQSYMVIQAGLADNSPPTATLISPTGSGAVSNTITLTASVSDDTRVTRVEFYANANHLLGIATSPPFSISVDTTVLPNGAQAFFCAAFDLAGNSTASAPVAVVVNNWFSWARGLGGTMPTDSVASSVLAVDGNDNVIIAGTFKGSADFGAGPLTSAGGLDLFLAKFSPSGFILWSKRFGGTGNDRARSVAVDLSGNIIITGSFEATVDFGGLTLISRGGEDVFLVKYTPAGTMLWARSIGGTGDENGSGVAVNRQSDAIFVTGTFGNKESPIYFGDSGSPVPLFNLGSNDIFLAKYSGNGQYLWSQAMGGLGTDQAESIAIDHRGDLVLSGTFDQTASFDGRSLVPQGNPDLFIAKYSDLGTRATCVWAARHGDAGRQQARGIAVDTTDNVVLSGISSGTSQAILLAKFNSQGLPIWSNSFTEPHGVATMGCSAPAIDQSGNIIITGMMGEPVSFGAGALDPSSEYHVFLAKFSSTGIHMWSTLFPGQGPSQGTAVAIDSAANILCSGFFSLSLDIPGAMLGSSGQAGFLSKFRP